MLNLPDLQVRTLQNNICQVLDIQHIGSGDTKCKKLGVCFFFSEVLKMAKERRKVEGVAEATLHEKSKAGRLFASFFAQDIATVKAHILDDIGRRVGDFAKELALFAVTEFTGNLLYGEKGRPKNSGYLGGYYNYSRSGSSSSSSTNATTAAKIAMKERLDYSNIELESREDLNRVIEEMELQIKHEGNVTVAELYALCKKTGANQTDCELGWTTLEGWGWKPMRDNRISLYLPKPIYLQS